MQSLINPKGEIKNLQIFKWKIKISKYPILVITPVNQFWEILEVMKKQYKYKEVPAKKEEVRFFVSNLIYIRKDKIWWISLSFFSR